MMDAPVHTNSLSIHLEASQGRPVLTGSFSQVFDHLVHGVRCSQGEFLVGLS